MMPITPETQAASATPQDKKPKWYHYLWALVAVGLIVWSFFDNGGNHLAAIGGLAALGLVGMLLWDKHVNGNIFDDRAGGH
jgi:ABC-type phosphate/phosphonate transport system permease subunit